MSSVLKSDVVLSVGGVESGGVLLVGLPHDPHGVSAQDVVLRGLYT
jgi:hypothetical protein